ncbi:MAG: hypothetical protein AAFQ79_17730 [Pseudomonadota bacterium]
MREFFRNLPLLATGFSFLRLRGGGIRQFQFVYPGLISVVLCIAIIDWDSFSYEFLPGRNLGPITATIGVISGFFIAALAAVSTFQSPNLDQKINGYGVTEPSAKSTRQEATRRRLLTKLFGYCTVLSVLALLLPLVGELSADWVESLLDRRFARLTARLFEVVYMFVNGSLFVSALLGIHYLVDRIHR